jgi:hypothetical protein
MTMIQWKCCELLSCGSPSLLELTVMFLVEFREMLAPLNSQTSHSIIQKAINLYVFNQHFKYCDLFITFAW